MEMQTALVKDLLLQHFLDKLQIQPVTADTLAAAVNAIQNVVRERISSAARELPQCGDNY